MKTLEEIKNEVGEKIFSLWRYQAERESARDPKIWGNADARHAIEYSYIINRYEQLIEKRVEQPKERKERGYLQL